jgi:hypothetical protein
VPGERLKKRDNIAMIAADGENILYGSHIRWPKQSKRRAAFNASHLRKKKGRALILARPLKRNNVRNS